MLDLAARHIMELAFSKHVDNKLDSPSSGFILLGCTFAIAMNTVWGGGDPVLNTLLTAHRVVFSVASSLGKLNL